MKSLGLIALLLTTTLLLTAGHRTRRPADQPLGLRAVPVQVIRSPGATRTPKTVRRVVRQAAK